MGMRGRKRKARRKRLRITASVQTPDPWEWQRLTASNAKGPQSSLDDWWALPAQPLRASRGVITRRRGGESPCGG